jgi:serine/threonine protein kinase
MAAAINHPNSVYILGAEEIEGKPVISMELISGGTLKDLVEIEGPLPVARAVDSILQVIAGLEAAANSGILHRDVKPANCFVDTDGTVKVGDYGLAFSSVARKETTVTATGSFLGTPAFASPEQLRGENLDVRSDIYAVGATLYYLLTAKLPFTSEHFPEVVFNIGGLRSHRRSHRSGCFWPEVTVTTERNRVCGTIAIEKTMRRTRNGRASLRAKDPLADLLPAYLDGHVSGDRLAILSERLKHDGRLRRELATILLQEELLREIGRKGGREIYRD